MILIIEGHDFHYELEKLCRIFFPEQKISVVTDSSAKEWVTAYAGISSSDGGLLLSAWLEMEGERTCASEEAPAGTTKSERERRLAVLLFGLLEQRLGLCPPWGILTGVRPVKLYRQLEERLGVQGAREWFCEKLLVSPEKAEKTFNVLRAEQRIAPLVGANTFSLYVGIPFCPSRCAYCSFVSSEVEKTAGLVPRYLELLEEELRAAARVAQELKLRLLSVYIGGGTPTVLSAEQLASLMHTITNSFNMGECFEFTVEAGRPDTVTREKLLSLREGGATRISVNPQTMDDAVLRRIGRRHTAEQTREAFLLAREMGFNNINMDLIAGLPGDTPQGFESTLRQVMVLSPENVTVHTLALKRAARLTTSGVGAPEDGGAAGEMIGAADTALRGGGYLPYYLYRQSRMAGNLENTGWTKPGFESLYNFCIMDECQSILACGAGAATKIKDPVSESLERIYNFKFPHEYIGRFGEILTRKEQVKQVYGSFSK